MSEALEAEIWSLKKTGPRFDAYTMPRLARYLGRWIYTRAGIRTARSGCTTARKAKWVGDFVHESVHACTAALGHLESNILHFTCDSLSEHLKTLDRYTTLAAQELAARKTASRRCGELIFDPAWTFCKTYLLQARLPGRPGGPDHRLHGGVLHVSEVLQSENHELICGSCTWMPAGKCAAGSGRCCG